MAQRQHYTYYKYIGQHHLPQLEPLVFGYRHLQIAHRHRWAHGQCHRLMQGDHTQRQHKRGECRQQQHHTVHPVEGLSAEHQSIEHVEHHYQHSHLGVVNQKTRHTISIFNLSPFQFGQ